MRTDTAVLAQYCQIPFSSVAWSVFVRRPQVSDSSNAALPEEQRLFLWQPKKMGKYQIVVKPFTLKPGNYRFEAKV